MTTLWWAQRATGWAVDIDGTRTRQHVWTNDVVQLDATEAIGPDGARVVFPELGISATVEIDATDLEAVSAAAASLHAAGDVVATIARRGLAGGGDR